MTSADGILVFFPTLNERDNVEALYRRLRAVLPESRIFVIDDQSTDGTREILQTLSEHDERFGFTVRTTRLGVGSAHCDAINHALETEVETLITLDSDFAHKPEDIPAFLEAAKAADIVIGNRFLRQSSLSEWAMPRRALTHLSHQIVRLMLRIDYDASGAFRVYKLKQIDSAAFRQIDAQDYEFFFESLAILDAYGARIASVPIDLPARVYGMSKMRPRHVLRAFARVIRMALRLRQLRRRLARRGAAHGLDPDDWDEYWEAKPAGMLHGLYAKIAKFYRVYLIEPSARAVLTRHLKDRARVLHAGSGSGQTDAFAAARFDLVACDLSAKALDRYIALNGGPETDGPGVLCADIRTLPFPDATFDGIYNLGVMEHFPESKMGQVLQEFDRVLNPGGKAVLFWPPVYGPSVIGLGFVHWILRVVGRGDIRLHPPEPTKVASRKQIERFLEGTSLKLNEMAIGPRDLFTYCAVVLEKQGDRARAVRQSAE